MGDKSRRRTLLLTPNSQSSSLVNAQQSIVDRGLCSRSESDSSSRRRVRGVGGETLPDPPYPSYILDSDIGWFRGFFCQFELGFIGRKQYIVIFRSPERFSGDRTHRQAVALVAFTLVALAVIVSNLSISYPISVPCQCKIVSSSVDIRSAKVCELGLLNYKAKHVFYPSEKKKFRCRYDYYWASVFEVEYTDHSGHPHIAFAEAPNEALPPDCRPTFNAAWMAKDRFKIFNCQADHPSMTEMLKRYLILAKKVYKKGNHSRSRYWFLDFLAHHCLGQNSISTQNSYCWHVLGKDATPDYLFSPSKTSLFSCSIFFFCELVSNSVLGKARSPGHL
ncbi:hypothetical protein Ccrd_006629, partial [Cynara cardunculus var. scolymus]